MRVESYGTGTQVRLPGKSAMEPRIFKFGTPYAEMYRSLSATPEDEAFFVHNGVLQLCKRGASVKVRLVILLRKFPMMNNPQLLQYV
jgi:RNA polymerase II subunit A C-terminal domain phosphatase SSU72